MMTHLKCKNMAPILISALLTIMTAGCGENAPDSQNAQKPAPLEVTKEQVEAAVEEAGGDTASKEDMLLETYASSEIPVTFGVLDAGSEYEAFYKAEHSGTTYHATASFEEPLTGVVSHSLADLDGDGVNELVAFFLQENHLQYLIFKVEDEKVVGKAVLDSSLDTIEGTDYAAIWTFLTHEGGRPQLTEIVYKRNALLTDTFSGSKTTYTYDGQTYAPSSSSYDCLADLEQEAAKKRKELEESFEDKDLFYMLGQNTAVETDDGLIASFGEEGDPSYLGSVAYRFAKGAADFRQMNSVESYTTKRREETVTCPDGTDITFSFEKVVFAGKNEKRIAKLNAKMDAVEAYFDAHIREMEEQIAEYEEFGGDFDIYDYVGENVVPYSVYYDEDGNVSVAYLWSYIPGSVFKDGGADRQQANMNRWVCANTNMQLGGKQTFFQKVDGGWQYLQDAIRDELAKEDDLDAGAVEGTIEGMYDFNFFYNQDKVYVCFDSQDIDGKNAEHLVELSYRPK